MLYRYKFLMEAAPAVHAFVTELDFPAKIPRKSVRETLHCRLNDILQKESSILFMGEARRQGQPNRHIIGSTANELLMNDGYHYNTSTKCYERKGPDPRHLDVFSFKKFTYERP